MGDELNREQKWLQYILSDLEKYDTFDSKDLYLQNMEFGKNKNGQIMGINDVFEKYPSIKENISKYMVSTVIDEFGPEAYSDGTKDDSLPYSFGWNVDHTSKISNNEIREALVKIENSNMKINELTDEMPEVRESLSTLKTRKQNLDSQINQLQSEIARQRHNFYWNSVPTLRKELGIFGPIGTVLGQTLSSVSKGAMQLGAGWTDWFKDTGTEKVENLLLNTTPDGNPALNLVEGETGAEFTDRVLSPLQDELTELYTERRGLYGEYESDLRLKENYTDLLKLNTSLKNLVNLTGYDEAKRYMSPDQLAVYLESGDEVEELKSEVDTILEQLLINKDEE